MGISDTFVSTYVVSLWKSFYLTASLASLTSLGVVVPFYRSVFNIGCIAAVAILVSLRLFWL